uniref:Uncharacterized protein n=1 Tax=Acrobeloides nanus TaxID=290746 RepID=A0A914C1H3_9BILA
MSATKLILVFFIFAFVGFMVEEVTAQWPYWGYGYPGYYGYSYPYVVGKREAGFGPRPVFQNHGFQDGQP